MKRGLILIILLVLISGCIKGGNTMENTKEKSVLMVIAPENFKDEEYFTPKQAFEERGIKVKTASTKEEATSIAGVKQKTDLLLNDATTDYEAVIFVGGPGASVYFNNENAIELAKKFNEKGKIVAAICIAPSILANAGLLKGKKATSFPSQESNLKEKGAEYTGDSVTIDGNIITGKDPNAAGEFAREIINNL